MAYRPPVPLAGDHELDEFDCDSQALNEWLTKYARAAQTSGSATVFVTTEDDGPAVVGYYALAMASVVRESAPERAARGQPAQIPAVLLGRLAVHREHQRQGVGRSLLQDVFARIIQAAELVGVHVLLVHAQDDNAKAWYMQYGFDGSPTDPLHLMMLMKDVRAHFARL